MSLENKIRENKTLLTFYEKAITEQKLNLMRVVRGVFKSVHVGDKVLYALIKGDLKLLEEKKAEMVKTIEELEKQLERET